jgi:DNA repair exonuclease SbcCD ATPase subunit
MKFTSWRRVVVLIVSVLLIGLFLIDSSAQRRRPNRKPSTPQITNPAIYQPSGSDETNSNTNTSTPTEGTETAPAENPEAMKQAIRDLSTQVDRLNSKISRMEESQQMLVDLERLSRAEQRSAALWKELREVESQQSDLQARLEEVNYALKPENIERSVAGYGTTRPEEVRAQRRLQLENEKVRVEKHLDQLAANHTRLEQAIATADAEAERLRKRLDDADQQRWKTQTSTGGRCLAKRASSPSPYQCTDFSLALLQDGP